MTTLWAGTGSSEEDNTLPEGLKDWNKQVGEVSKDKAEPEGKAETESGPSDENEGNQTLVETPQEDVKVDNLTD